MHETSTMIAATATRPAPGRARALLRRFLLTAASGSPADYCPTIVTPRCVNTAPIGFATAVLLLPA